MMNKILKKIILVIREVVFKKTEVKRIYLLTSNKNNKTKIVDILNRLQYFDIKIEVVLVEKFSFLQYFNFDAIGFVDQTERKKVIRFLEIIKKDCLFNFDYDLFYLDGWEYHRLLSKIKHDIVLNGEKKGKEILNELKQKLSQKYLKTYIFGTGPSLEKSINKTWSDGIIIVSNTIVKDEELWSYLQPDFIVAGDAIYHFGFSDFAKKFRSDLKKRLKETNTFFVFPSSFYPFCLTELSEFSDRMIPIPIDPYCVSIEHDLSKNYFLPSLGNVLPLLLLPLACSLTENIFMTGFDGRSPSDKMFWKNSNKHFYSEDVEQLTKLHPAFFSKLVPQGNQSNYVKTVHGDSLDKALSNAEEKGFVFKMTHFSYTETLNKRYDNT